ncbi:hypothetical protein [Hymenobacter sp. PAMC 26628]|uniref:hypothetical protein n=1 Tax=Hymenobacter sp. PAMC 26628 TaxID=1484118 RepID=UPI000770128B|nr:hypothetical protein [Hymenobacter sp. PAMC 26628]AMJ65992.1 hypothetical protein AXW84_11535 [Hymenobacter sp. PAMC 26628]
MKKKPAPLATPPATPELATKAHEGTPEYGDYGHPPTAPTPPAPDHRADGGDIYDLSHEQTAL